MFLIGHLYIYALYGIGHVREHWLVSSWTIRSKKHATQIVTFLMDVPVEFCFRVLVKDDLFLLDEQIIDVTAIQYII